MAVLYGSTSTVVNGALPTAPGLMNGAVRTFVERITYATQTTSDTIVCGYLPIGAKVLGVILTTSVTTGSATIAIGITGTVAKYKAAAAFTAVDTPTFFGIASVLNTPLAAAETVFITIAAASLPAAGTLDVTWLYAVD